ncbi:unnamed protein product [Blepharisma stoltei]|uniref:Uncharacterized protein n=1 Tax=Blepharisma stoltei TaxID=1481888 RepID=A0AAU9JKG5_9CILI|nr:unnamed protein product [Blepharisma stoltei]
MEIKRPTNWAESISSILRKTELNLLKLQRTNYHHDEYARPPSTMTQLDLSMDQRQRSSFFEPTDNASLIQQELSGFKQSIEKLFTEKYKQHQSEMYNLSLRVTDLEDKQIAFEDLKEELQNTLLAIGRKTIGENRKFDDNTKNYATKEDLKLVEESFQHIRQHQINKIEMQIRDIMQENLGIRDYVNNIADEKNKENLKKSISPYEIRSIKEEIQYETNVKIKEIERKFCNDIEDIAKQYRQQNEDHYKSLKELANAALQKYDSLSKLVDEAKQNSGKLQNTINLELSQIKNQSSQPDFNIVNELKQNIENAKNYASDEIERIKKALKLLENSIDSQDIELEIEGLKKRIDVIPAQPVLQDLSNFVSREEFNQINVIKKDLKQLEDTIKSHDLNKEIEALRKEISHFQPQDLSNFVTKSYLAEQIGTIQPNQEISNQLISIHIKLKEQGEASSKLSNKIDDLEHHLIQIEEESSEEISLELSKKEGSILKKQEQQIEVKPEENKEYSGLATFGKPEESKDPEELVAISFNNLGESDDDSQGFISPLISPMNQVVVGPIGSAKPIKKFQFSEPLVIEEDARGEESASPHQRANENKKDLDEYIAEFTKELIRTELEDGLLVVKEVLDRVPKPKVGQRHEKLLPKKF